MNDSGELIQPQTSEIKERTSTNPVVISIEDDSNLMNDVQKRLGEMGFASGNHLPMIIHIENPGNEPPIKYDGTAFEHDEGKIHWPQENFEHYAKLFNLKETWEKMGEAFKNDPNSKRLIVSFWQPGFVESDIAPSLLSIQFLKKDENLSMFVHMRSNKLSEKFALNYQMLSAVHMFASESWGIKRGSYNHMVNMMDI